MREDEILKKWKTKGLSVNWAKVNVILEGRSIPDSLYEQYVLDMTEPVEQPDQSLPLEEALMLEDVREQRSLIRKRTIKVEVSKKPAVEPYEVRRNRLLARRPY